MNADKICLVEFHRPENKIPTFSELIGALLSSFNELGIETGYMQNQIDSNATNIIFGSHRLFQSFEKLQAFPKNCIFFNLEHLYVQAQDNPRIRYLELLKNSFVIDYSDKNYKALVASGNNLVHRFRFGHIPLSPFTFSHGGSHLLFYGVLSDRRKQIIDSLFKSMIPLRVISGYWGFERDYEISESGAVLNISKHNDTILEIYRIWHSLCLGTPVITEKGADPVLVEEWKKYVHFIGSSQEISTETSKLAPHPELYRKETSFLAECVRLRDWIRALPP